MTHRYTDADTDTDTDTDADVPVEIANFTSAEAECDGGEVEASLLTSVTGEGVVEGAAQQLRHILVHQL